MTGTRRQRDSTAPSLFPFLAVLLCTMGALVVILMLVVSGAQASAKQVAQESRMRTEDVESQLELAKSSYQRQLQEGQIDLEKKRLRLQHFEQHILELTAELEELERTAVLLDEETNLDAKKQSEKKEAVSELEKQLAAALENLKQKLDKPEGDKPIFAIIPYEGSNGTHRRPIYLECTASNVVIQPLGIKLSLQDLQPPYGPGNPLDAALRTIRAEYTPANGAVTHTAYPLLVVRPSGIRTYSLARAAMSGWDDQFGYELLGEDVELTFPDAEPGLSQKIVKTLELARERQAALVMAMPRRYKQFSGEFNPATSADSLSEGSAMGQSYGSETQSSDGTGLGRGGYATNRDANQAASFSRAGTGIDYPPSLGGFGASDPTSPGRNASSTFGSDSTSASPGSVDPSAAAGDAYSQLANHAGSQTESVFGPASGPANASSGQGTTGGSSGNGQSSPSSAASNSSHPSAGSAAGSGSQSPQANQIAMPLGASAGGSNSGSNASQSTGTANSAATTPLPESVVDGAAQGIPQLSLNSNLSPSRQNSQAESSQPVASQRGRNWAWSQGPPTQTTVVRSIHLHCFTDRCILLPDNGNPEKGIVISFDLGPQERAEKLARAVHDRVDSWGMALASGHWKPVLVVDVAPDASWRFDQLARLLEGSGLEMTRRTGK